MARLPSIQRTHLRRNEASCRQYLRIPSLIIDSFERIKPSSTASSNESCVRLVENQRTRHTRIPNSRPVMDMPIVQGIGLHVLSGASTTCLVLVVDSMVLRGPFLFIRIGPTFTICLFRRRPSIGVFSPATLTLHTRRKFQNSHDYFSGGVLRRNHGS
ncbi:hypothetical protein CC78DRAFT_361982 [Lojkania enalia]|uniref:Uncharacterized protein n=1 Tax=Lojkania enalia TaxID=147567 RepID=A0A9P4K7X8_9PLEO|nr:hypothetical protein CC78DRAFT_361982 [Didymosphaeria enalia]